MRAVVTISMPIEEKKEVERRAKKAHKTLSSYILDSLHIMKSLISEEELLERAQEAEKNYKKGKTKVLRSLSDLIGD